MNKDHMNIYGELFEQMFYSYETFANNPTDAEFFQLEREYKLIQAKKSTLSASRRKKICILYEKFK